MKRFAILFGAVLVLIGNTVAQPSESSADNAPKVVEIFPPNGATNVSAKLKSLRIVFDRPMSGGFSLCRGRGVSWNCHPTIGTHERPVWSPDRKSVTFPMDLRPGRLYKVSLNRGRAHKFRSAEGVPLKDTDYSFFTEGTAEPDPRHPHVLKIEPANGARDVDPDTRQIVVTFDRPMGRGRSVARSNQGTWDDYPKIVGTIALDETRTVVTIPVSLVPGKTYKLQLNNRDACGFASVEGFCLEDYAYTFTTRKSK